MKPAVLVIGATGTIGTAVVQAALDADWPVVGVARDAGKLQQLSQRHPHAPLQVVAGSVADDASAATLMEELQRLARPLLGVIVALGAGSERGRLLDQPVKHLRRSFDDAVLPHLVAARHLMPLLAASGRNCGYVIVGGPGGRCPWAGYGLRSVTTAAVRMLAQVLHTESRSFSVRLQLLEVASPVRTDANAQHACQRWPAVDDIGRMALELLLHRNDSTCAGAVIEYRRDAAFFNDSDNSQRSA